MNNDLDIYKMYDLVFEDIVQNYIECLNEDVEDNKDLFTLTEEEKKEIAYRLIHKDEPLWEYINETIYWEIKYMISQTFLVTSSSYS